MSLSHVLERERKEEPSKENLKKDRDMVLKRKEERIIYRKEKAMAM